MLANSEFLLMLSQAPTDQQELVKMLRISEEQLSYISNAESGHGLIKVGGAKVPFINQLIPAQHGVIPPYDDQAG